MVRESPRRVEAAPTRWRRVQEILAAAAMLFAIIGVGAVAVGGAIYLWVAELRGFANTVMLVGVAFLLLAMASSALPIWRALTGQRGRFAANTIIMVAAFLAITVIVNFITFQAGVRIDTTASRQFSLSEQTLAVLDNLDQQVEATAFFVPGIPGEIPTRQRAKDLMFEYQNRSRKTFTYRFVDPEADPSVARELGAVEYPSIVFEAKDSGQRLTINVPPIAEQNLTSALLIVTGEQRKLIYFLQGNGERDPSGTGTSSDAYGLAAGGLLSDSYAIRTLNLSRSGAVPEDVAVLIIAGPSREMPLGEQEILKEWLKGGGRALFLLDPDPPASFEQVLLPWGIDVGDGTVVDVGSSLYGAPRSPLLQRNQYLPDVAITQLLDAILFPEAAPVQITVEEKKRPPWIQYIPLAISTILSWSTEDPERDTFLPAEDTAGPHLLAIAVDALSTVEEDPPAAVEDAKLTSIIVIGDADFASNQYYSYSTNKDLFLNSVNWLAQDFDLISVRPRAVAFRNLVVTRSEFDFIRYTSWFLLPTVLALVGLVVWWRRR